MTIRSAAPGGNVSNDKSSRDFRRDLCEILLSLNLGGASVCVMFALNFATLAFFSRTESRIKIFLHMRQTDLVVGHLASWIPTALGALMIWVLLRKTAPSNLTTAFVRWAAGIIMVSTPLIVEASLYKTTYWMEWWRRGALVSEMLVALVLIWRFQSGRWKPHALPGLLLLSVHFAFWWFVPEMDPTVPGYEGPAGPILGFFGAVAWCRYIST